MTAAQKAGNGNPLFPELRKNINDIAPVGGNGAIALTAATDRTLNTNDCRKINFPGLKRFFVFPNRLTSVTVRNLNRSAAFLPRRQVFLVGETVTRLLAGGGYPSKINFLPHYLNSFCITSLIILPIRTSIPMRYCGY